MPQRVQPFTASVHPGLTVNISLSLNLDEHVMVAAQFFSFLDMK